jgi:hypothetical protein
VEELPVSTANKAKAVVALIAKMGVTDGSQRTASAADPAVSKRSVEPVIREIEAIAMGALPEAKN